MSDRTGIQWTDATWNPVSGCTKISSGCKNCYAERDWARLSANPRSPYFGRVFTDVRCHPERLDQPLRWRRPRRIFVNSISDLFHEDVPDEFLGEVFKIMTCPPVPGLHQGAQHHTFQILTKRPQRMQKFCAAMAETGWIPPNNACGVSWPAPNIWLGVSVETDEDAEYRIGWLQRTPAAVRFLSVEPLLGPIGLDKFLLRDIDWVIVGGESGPNARPCDVEWIRWLIFQCIAAAVPVFVKQLGANVWTTAGLIEGHRYLRLRDRKGGDPAEWPKDLRIREFPAIAKQGGADELQRPTVAGR